MVALQSSFSVMVVTSMLVGVVQGHGYMSVPAVTWTNVGGDTTQPMSIIESTASGFSGNFGASPADNTAAFTKGFAASDYTSLKEFVTKLGKVASPDFTIECGYSNPNGTPQPLPETYIEWSHGSGEGFTASHEGPCEAWCDDVRVFQDDDCPANFPTAPAKMPYDRDACLGASRLTFYWIALHSSSWQVYTNCAALEATTSTGATSEYAVGSNSNSTTTNTEAPVDSTEVPIPTTIAPEYTETPATNAPDTGDPATDAPATEATATDAPVSATPATESPTTEVEASEADSSKCSVRRRL